MLLLIGYLSDAAPAARRSAALLLAGFPAALIRGFASSGIQLVAESVVVSSIRQQLVARSKCQHDEKTRLLRQRAKSNRRLWCLLYGQAKAKKAGERLWQ